MAYVFQTFSKDGRPHKRWRFQYIDWKGRKRTATGATSKTATVAIADQVQLEQDKIRKHKVRPEPKPSDTPQPIAEAIEAYLAAGRANGGHGGRPWSANHAHNREQRLKWWFDALQLTYVHELENSLARVESVMQRLRKVGCPRTRFKRKQTTELSGRTLNHYAESLRAFIQWAMERGYLTANPLMKLPKYDTTPVRIRRAMSATEIRQLLAGCKEYRRLTYEVAFMSGLRVSELRALDVKDLDTVRGGLQLRAAWTKNRKAGFQPLPPALVQRLATFAATGEATELYRTFGSKLTLPVKPLLYVPSHPARDLGKDLKAAGLERTTSEGTADFHACRVAYTTLIFENGATVKEAQTLARHSDPRLTANVYGRTRDERLAAVAEALGNQLLVSTTVAQSVLNDPVKPCPTTGNDKRATGIEPATFGLGSQRSATELRPQN